MPAPGLRRCLAAVLCTVALCSLQVSANHGACLRSAYVRTSGATIDQAKAGAENNKVCTWVIEAPLGSRVTLNFSRLALTSQNCDRSFLLVLSTPGVVPPRICGSTTSSSLPSPITSTGNIMTVVLDSEDSDDEFSATVVFTPASNFTGGGRV
jgi:hypothetical protein